MQNDKQIFGMVDPRSSVQTTMFKFVDLNFTNSTNSHIIIVFGFSIMVVIKSNHDGHNFDR